MIDSGIITQTLRGKKVVIEIMNMDAIAIILIMRGARWTIGEDINPAIVKERVLAMKVCKSPIDIMNDLVPMGVMTDQDQDHLKIEVMVKARGRIAMKMAILRGVKDEGIMIVIVTIKDIMIQWHHQQRL